VRDDEKLRDDIRREVLRQTLSVAPDTIGVPVDGGAVLPWSVAVELALRLPHALPGIVDAHSELTNRIDDVAVN
jgi:hypothetical protein